MQLRAATPTDIPAITAICINAFAENGFYGFIFRTREELWGLVELPHPRLSARHKKGPATPLLEFELAKNRAISLHKCEVLRSAMGSGYECYFRGQLEGALAFAVAGDGAEVADTRDSDYREWGVRLAERERCDVVVDVAGALEFYLKAGFVKMGETKGWGDCAAAGRGSDEISATGIGNF
ncbi:hypothetical protein FN846DRAFT_931591 [Sphaerosporella brunnea]|uniref:Uncharacterized protein n=1 Tax=Sphaerosporella brunnea TaxID=1250544 RepID=A0A5J5F7F3_9PEZI|nr:hypothetical protein FN846DRAFT_931591 [Sphaerosporella brunnea]